MTKFRDGKAPKPLAVTVPVKLAVEFMDTQHADRAYLIPGVERAGGTRLEYTAPDMITAYRCFRALVALARD
jgi:D-aminopeptidase